MSKFRLLDLRHDAAPAVGLIMGAAIVFQQPLRFVLNVAGAMERQYNLDLLPALVVLSVVFMFHQSRKRQESRAAALAAETAARLERARATELEELVTLGRSLADALDYRQMEQVLWRRLPEFLRDSQLSLIVRERAGWSVLVQDTGLAAPDGAALERLASLAAATLEKQPTHAILPVTVDGFVCFPVFANNALAAIALVRDDPAMRNVGRHGSFAPMLAFIGIALRNVQLLAEIRDHSLRDGLTRWFNRAHGLETLELELRRAYRTAMPLAVVMFDIDHFKDINDRYGHLHGDALLAAVTRHIDDVLRVSDIRCRYGGDEFLVILPDTPPAGARLVAEHIRQAVASVDVMAGPEHVSVTCSVGLALARIGELDVEEIVSRADAAMYKSKRSGRNRIAGDEPSDERQHDPAELIAVSA
jgi:diguanylate cyclase (GGDEF)-like protein